MFQNVTNKYLKKETEVVVEATFVNPNNESFSLLLDMSVLWGIKIMIGGSSFGKSRLSISLSKFKYLTGKNPIIGNIYKINGTERFLAEIKVINIIGSKNGN